MNEEKQIYIAIDKDGIILDNSISQDLWHIESFLQQTLPYLKDKGITTFIIRPISVYSIENIIGKHWENVDCDMLRLRECSISNPKTKRYMEVYDNGDPRPIDESPNDWVWLTDNVNSFKPTFKTFFESLKVLFEKEKD